MAKDPKLAGSEFLRETLALLPAEKRAPLEALLADADAAAALTKIGEGALRQSDYDRQMDTARTAQTRADALYESNTAWFTEHKAALTELDSLRTRLAAVEVPDPNAVPAAAKLPDNVLTREQFNGEIDKLERGAVGFMDELTDLKFQHYRDFNEVLDTRTLLADKRVQQIGLKGVYQETYKEKLTAKSTAAQTARDEAIRKDAVLAYQREQAGSHAPYPVRGNEPSTLDGLEAAAGKPVVGKSADEMVSEYARLGAARAGA